MAPASRPRAGAGLVADADQGRALAGLTSLSGYTPTSATTAQTLPRLYQLTSSDYHDITVGNDNYDNTGGYTAGVGYDLASGLGTPIANKLVPDLAGDATVSGRAFVDANANGTYDGTDSTLSSLAGQTVYLDLNNNGVRDTATYDAEPTATIAANGTFTFTNLAAGGDLLGGLTGTVRLLNGTPTGYVLVNTGSTFTTAYASTVTANLGLFPITYSTAAAGTAYAVQESATSSTTLQVLVNGTVADTAPLALVPSLTFTLTGTGDSLAVDFANGSPVPTGGLGVNGSAAANGDTLSVLGTAGNDTITVNSGTVVFGSSSSTITYANVPNLSVDPRGGTDALAVNAGTVTLPAQTAGSGFLARTFSTLTVANGATLAVGTAAARADRTVLVAASASALSVGATAKLDLGGNDLVVHGGAVATVSALAGTGFNAGLWTGYGLASSAAAASRRTALGVVQNVGTTGAALYATFDGVAVSATDVLVKYTYYGDANLSGTVDAADYSRVDAGYVTHATGWANGDFNYDGTVDGSDYSLIDDSFNQQTSSL